MTSILKRPMFWAITIPVSLIVFILLNPVLFMTATLSPGPQGPQTKCVEETQSITEHLASRDGGVTQFFDPNSKVWLRYTGTLAIVGEETAGGYQMAEIPLANFNQMLADTMVSDKMYLDGGESNALRVAQYLFASRGNLKWIFRENPLLRDVKIHKVLSKEDLLKALGWKECE